MRRIIYILLKKFHLLKYFNKFTKVGKLDPEINVYCSDEGYFAIPAENLDLIESFIYFNENHVDLDILRRYLGLNNRIPKKVFLDLGANIGEYSIGLRKYFEKIVAVEGNPFLVKCLKISAVLNENDIEVLQKWIVPNENKNWEVSYTKNSLTTYLAEGDTSIINENDICTLEELIGMYSPNVLKLDLEGLDIELLLETSSLSLKKIDYIIFESTDVEFINSQIEIYLNKAGLHLSAVTNLKKNRIIEQLSLLSNLNHEIYNYHFKKTSSN